MGEGTDKGTDGKVSVSRQYKDGKLVTREEGGEEQILVARFPGAVEPAWVGFSARMTVNLGNYESCQMAVEARVPCHVEEMDDAFAFVKDFVDKRLGNVYLDVRDYRDELKKKAKEGESHPS